MTGADQMLPPLAGVRIVEFEAIGPLPLAGMLLADMGADVVRIARPAHAEAWADVGGAIVDRGRRIVELDLKTQAEDAFALIERADVLLEGLRPGVMERLGLGPADCLARNPRVVYGRITGWGQTGPLAQRAGHDINYIGLTGALHAIGSAGAPPPPPLNLVGDYGGGSMFLIAGVLAALLSARATGRGQVVDAAITDGVAAMSAMFHALRRTGAWSDRRDANLLDGAAPFYRCYACADGKFVAVGALEPRFFAVLLRTLGLAEEDFPQHDHAAWPAMAATFARTFAQRPRDEWAALFADTDACVTPVLDWSEAPSHPHHQARGTFTRTRGAPEPAPAPRLAAAPELRPARTATADELLREWAAGRR